MLSAHLLKSARMCDLLMFTWVTLEMTLEEKPDTKSPKVCLDLPKPRLSWEYSFD